VYIYDATGVKLKKVVTNSGATTSRYYTGLFEYDDNKALVLMHTDEGMVNVSHTGGLAYTYEYHLKDHLGNIRAIAESGNNIPSQLNDYYPFGMLSKSYTTGSTTNKYLYNGKELQDELDLEWYDYGARFYDPQIGRFTTVDPLTEWHFNYTPYHYTFNNPMNFTDPFGLDTVPAKSEIPIKKDDVVVGEDGTYTTAGTDQQNLDQVTITAKRPGFLKRILRKIDRLLQGNSTYEKEGGTEFTSEFKQGGHENSTAKNPDAQSVNSDYILALKPSGPRSYGFNPINTAKGIFSASKAGKEINNMLTPDKTIVKQKTDAHGNPLYFKAYIWNCKGKSLCDEDIRDTLVSTSDTAFIKKMLTDEFVRIER